MSRLLIPCSFARILCTLYFINLSLYHCVASDHTIEEVDTNFISQKLHLLAHPEEENDEQATSSKHDLLAPAQIKDAFEKFIFKQKVKVIKISQKGRRIEKIKAKHIKGNAWHYDTQWELDSLDREVNDRMSEQGASDPSQGSVNFAKLMISATYKHKSTIPKELEREEPEHTTTQPTIIPEEKKYNFSSLVFVSRGASDSLSNETRAKMLKRGWEPKGLADTFSTQDEHDFKKQIIEFFELEGQLSSEQKLKVIEDFLRQAGLRLDESRKNELSKDPLVLTSAAGFNPDSNLKIKAILTKASWAIFPNSNDQYYKGKGENLQIAPPELGFRALTSIPAMLLYPNPQDDFYRTGIGKSLDVMASQRGVHDWVGKTADLLIHGGENFTREFYHSEQVVRYFIQYTARMIYGLVYEVRAILDGLRAISQITSESRETVEKVDSLLRESEVFRTNPWEALLPGGLDTNLNNLRNVNIHIASHRLICPVCAATYFYDINHKNQLQNAILHAIREAAFNKDIEATLRNEFNNCFDDLKSRLRDLSLNLEEETAKWEDLHSEINFRYEILQALKKAKAQYRREDENLQRDIKKHQSKNSSPKGKEKAQEFPKRFQDRIKNQELLNNLIAVLEDNNDEATLRETLEALRRKLKDNPIKFNGCVKVYVSSCRK